MFHSSQGRRTSEDAPTSPTSPLAGLPPHLAVGDHTQPESIAIVSMSEVAGVEKHEDWVDIKHEDVPPNIESVHGYQQVH